MSEHKKLEEFIHNLPLQVQNVITKVIKAELEKLHLKIPRGIKDKIRQIIQQESDRHET